MQRTEFNAWLQGHMAVFALVQAHYDKLTDEQKQSMEAAWFSVLCHTEASDAVDATNRMVADPNLQPKGGAKEDRVPRHITRVRDLAEDARKRRQYGQWTEDGEHTIACLRCMDTTWILIWVTELGDQGESGVTTCPYCDFGKAALKKQGPKGYRDRPGGHLEWVESVLVPGKTRAEQRLTVAKLEGDRAWEVISERQGHRRRRKWTPRVAEVQVDGDRPREATTGKVRRRSELEEEGFRHIGDKVPF